MSSPSTQRIEAVIFDWGGTLTPWKTVGPRDAWHAYARTACCTASAIFRSLSDGWWSGSGRTQRLGRMGLRLLPTERG